MLLLRATGWVFYKEFLTAQSLLHCHARKTGHVLRFCIHRETRLYFEQRNMLGFSFHQLIIFKFVTISVEDHVPIIFQLEIYAQARSTGKNSLPCRNATCSNNLGNTDSEQNFRQVRQHRFSLKTDKKYHIVFYQ